MQNKLTRPIIIRHIFISNKSGTPINPTSITPNNLGNLIVTGTAPNEASATNISIEGKILWRFSRSTNSSAAGVYASAGIDKNPSEIEYNSSAYLDNNSLLLCGSEINIRTRTELPLVTILDSRGHYVKDIHFNAGFDTKINRGKILSCLKSGDKLLVTAAVLGTKSYELWLFSFSDTARVSWIFRQSLSDSVISGKPIDQQQILDSENRHTNSIISFWGASASSYLSIDGQKAIIHVTDNNNSGIYIFDIKNNLLSTKNIKGRSLLLLPNFNAKNIYLYAERGNRRMISIIDLNLKPIKLIIWPIKGIKIPWGGFVQKYNTLVMYGESGFGLLVSPFVSNSSLDGRTFLSKYIGIEGGERGPFAQAGTYLPQNQYAVATPVAKNEARDIIPSRHNHSAGCDVVILSIPK
jgi:hypothetical protein